MQESQFIRKIAVGTAFFGLIFAPILSFAQDTGNDSGSLVKKLVSDEIVQLDDLGIENPGLLQTNPFYFIKDLRRSTQRTFLFNALKRAELELDILNEKAAEIKFLENINSNNLNDDALASALTNYNDTLNRLRPALKNLKDTSKNPNIDRLLNNLVDRNLKHAKVFDELKLKADTGAKEKLESLEEAIAEISADSLDRLDAPENVKERILKILANQNGGAFKELRAVEILSGIAEKVPYGSPLKGALLGLKEDLLLKEQVKINLGNLNSVLPAVLQLLPGDFSDRVKVLDEAREYLTDVDLRNDFSLIRQLLLDLSAKSRGISKPEAEKLLNEAVGASDALRSQLAGFRSQSANALLARAEFNLKQAQESFKGNQYLSAFGQASISLAAANNGLNQLFKRNSLQNEIQNLKTLYDSLKKSSDENGLTGETAPKLFEVLTAAEKSLAKVSDLAAKDLKSDKPIPALRDAKVLVFTGEAMLKDLLARLEESAKEKKSSQPLIERVLPNSAKDKEIKKEAIDDLKKAQ